VVDLNAAFHDAKFMSDNDLQKELQSPSGLVPDYIVMSELQERQAVRSSSMGKGSKLSMKDELLQSLPRPQPMAPQGYASGGLVSVLNPFYAMAQGMDNPKTMSALMQEQMNHQAGGLPSLTAAQTPGAPGAPPELQTLVPTRSLSPQDPPKYASGGLASLKR
jgi:hypothetical protein